MDRHRSSVHTGPGFVPNPLYSKVDSLFNQDNRDLIQEIGSFAEDFFKIGAEFGDFLEDEFLELAMEKYGDRLDMVLDAYEQVPEELPSMPAAPPPQAVYSRCALDTPVLDLGSGDGRKAEKSGIKNIVLSDKVKNTRPCSKKYIAFDAEVDEVKDDRVITSNMVLTQVRNLEKITATDGVHLVPDCAFLRTMGAKEEDGALVVVSKGKVFRDYDHHLKGLEIQPGYLGVNTFKPRSLYINIVGGPLKLGAPSLLPVLEGVVISGPDVTPKFDGVQLFLDCKKDGTGCLVNRSGCGFKISHDTGISMQLLLEEVGDVKKVTYVLTRIYGFNGFLPWHAIGNLENFTKNVKIEIDGWPVISPTDKGAAGLPTDGYIVRKGELDYRVKSQVTIDLDDSTYRDLVSKLEEGCFSYTIDPKEPGLVEYLYSCDHGDHHFKHVKKRVDKRSPTSISTISYYMGL